MPKEKKISRKKYETDVSDALFHVTPQPSIDIFEALGGAINVQTAAFLTGKIDNLNAPINTISEEPTEPDTPIEPVESAQLFEPLVPVKTVPTKATKSKRTPSQASPIKQMDHEDDSQNGPSLPASNAQNDGNKLEKMDLEIVQNEPSIESSPSDHTTEHAISYASSYDSSYAIFDPKNSIENSTPTSTANSTASSYAIFDPENSIENSTPTSTLTSTPNNAQNSIENSTLTAPLLAPKNSIENSPQNSDENVQNLLVCPEPQAPKQKPANITHLTRREEELLQFLRQNHGEVVSYTQVLKSLNWRESQRCTARNIIARFESNGIIKRERIQGSRYQGYRFTICEYTKKEALETSNSAYNAPQTKQAHKPLNLPLEFASQSPPCDTQNSIENSIETSMLDSMLVSAPSSKKIDRLINLSIWESDQETIGACWPAVAAAGFRSAHLRQLQSIFELQGFELDTVSLGLRYLDWQLEQGPLTNARGEVIADPIAYWLSSMRRHGYYSRPKGYVDPLLEAKRLLAEEEQARLMLQAQLDEIRQQTESLAEDQRCERLFSELIAQGESHALWLDFYHALPQMFRQRVDTEGPEVLAKKYAMVKALVKKFV